MTDQKVHQDGTLDQALAARAQRASELPWLELKVMSQVEYREQAKQWLKAHPGGLGARRPQSPRARLWQLLSTLVSSRVWQTCGVILLTLAALYVVFRLPAFAELARAYQPGTLLTIGASFAVLAVALVNWPRLRQFYT